MIPTIDPFRAWKPPILVSTNQSAVLGRIFRNESTPLTYGYPGGEADVVDESEDIWGAEVAQAEHRHDHHAGGRGHLAHLERSENI